MKYSRLIPRVGLALSLGGTMLVLPAAAHAQKMDKEMSRTEMEKKMSGWPEASRKAAKAMMDKYGVPMEMTMTMAMWGKAGQWKRTIVYDKEVQHDFPAPHTDVMQQFIDLRVPTDMFDDLAAYDGSVVVNRTNGEISARCDLEAANFLALNLAHEIIMGKRSSADARKMYGEQITAMKAGRPAPYTERLMFTVPTGGTADPDKPPMMDKMGKAE